MTKRKEVLFLQLPQTDNDVGGKQENIPLAAALLRYAAAQVGEDAHYRFASLPDALLDSDNPTLLAALVARKPAVVACTLYLWNIERTLRLMGSLRAALPGVRILLGGPEVAAPHPFLFRRHDADAIVIGEGETVFPALLRSFRTGRSVSFSTVFLRTPGGYRQGKTTPPPVDLATHLPPPGYQACRPDANGMAYLETSRGCPMRCTYCRYPHLRHSMSFLEPDDILARITALKQLGSREIRFVDPTFNAHPRFGEIIRRLASFNRTRRLQFFAELHAERLTDTEADLLAAARFAEIEVGVQSRDPAVLKLIRRPTSQARLDEGIRRLTRRKIKVTVDIMYGLPGQTMADVKHSIAWALRLPRADVQCLHTLLLPGTELRDRRNEWHMRAQSSPPYAVLSTATMTAGDFQDIERHIASHPRLSSDNPTVSFVGRTLPNLFPEQIAIRVDTAFARAAPDFPIPGTTTRRAIQFAGPDLFARRRAIGQFIRRAVRELPDVLFQFILCPEQEEPMDLLDGLVATLRRQPPHRLDRPLEGKLASRRILVKLPTGKRLETGWINAVEALLGDAFF